MTSQRIRHFVETYRPVLAEPGNSYLLPGTGQQPLSKPAIQSSLRETVATEMGVHVHPHLMRHFAAWLYLDLHPGAYEIVRRILGHRRIETTIQNYCGLETQAAAATSQKSVAGRRDQTRMGAAAAFGRRGRSGTNRPKVGKGGGK